MASWGSQDAPIMGPVIRSYLGGVEIGEPGKGMNCGEGMVMMMRGQRGSG
jgi:hypothetical protein